jgi:hypothetical protein
MKAVILGEKWIMVLPSGGTEPIGNNRELDTASILFYFLYPTRLVKIQQNPISGY